MYNWNQLERKALKSTIVMVSKCYSSSSFFTLERYYAYFLCLVHQPLYYYNIGTLDQGRKLMYEGSMLWWVSSL